jgi:hypothetical protein
MGKRYQSLSDEDISFIRAQKLFFVGTAANNGSVNVSPKGWDALRVMTPNRIVWRNVTGSGNETAAHLAENGRLTMMFCAFDGKPKILRLYGKAQAFHRRDPLWAGLDELFEPHRSSRQLVDFQFELVQTSCGFGVPFYDFVGERDNMDKWLASKDDDAIKQYWKLKNSSTIDGVDTGILSEDELAEIEKDS